MRAMMSRRWLGMASAVMVLASACSEPTTEVSANPSGKPATFATPEAAAAALVAASEPFDTAALTEILGADGVDLVVTDDEVLDKTQGAEFAAEAREKTQIVRDPKDPNVATILVGDEAWPMPIPLAQQDGRWRFDSAAG